MLVGVDEHSRWWSAVLAAAVHWSLLTDSDDGSVTDSATLQRLYAIIDNVPKQSHSSE